MRRTFRYQITLPGQHASREKRGTRLDLRRDLMRAGIERRAAVFAIVSVEVLLDQEAILIYSQPTFTITARAERAPNLYLQPNARQGLSRPGKARPLK